MKKSIRLFAALAMCAAGLTVSTNAFADCSDMGNSEWQELSTTMASLYEAGSYEDALSYGKRLTLICNRSPVVNYMISEIYRKSGNEEESDKYAKRATEFILEYPVPQALTERIWMRRAENELPYKKQLQDLQGRMTKMAGDLRACDALKSENAAFTEKGREDAIRAEYLAENSKRRWWGALWAGVGIAGAGIVSTVVGGVLIANSDKIEAKGTPTADKSGFAITKPYVAGWALLGGGLVATVGGTVLTGIAGYRYTHLNVDIDNDGQKDETVSFNLSPSYVSLGMTF